MFSLVEPQMENQLVLMPCCGIRLGCATNLEIVGVVRKINISVFDPFKLKVKGTGSNHRQ